MAESDGQPQIEETPAGAIDKAKDALVDLKKHSHAALEIALIVILVLSFLAIAFTWLEREFLSPPGQVPADVFVQTLTSTQLKLPLILFGASIIALLLLTTPKGAAVLIAVIIIGTVVAQEHFLMAVAHMFSGSRAPYADYHTTTPATANGQQIQPGFSVSTQVDRIKNDPSNALKEKLSKIIQDGVEQAVLDTMASSDSGANPTDIASQAASRSNQLIGREIDTILKSDAEQRPHDYSLPRAPRHHQILAAVVNGYTTFKALGERADIIASFDERMAKLSEEGYVSCPESDWASCAPTETGRSFVDQLDVGQMNQ